MGCDPDTATSSKRHLVHQTWVQGPRAWDSLGFRAGRWGPSACRAPPHHARGGPGPALACSSRAPGGCGGHLAGSFAAVRLFWQHLAAAAEHVLDIRALPHIGRGTASRQIQYQPWQLVAGRSGGQRRGCLPAACAPALPEHGVVRADHHAAAGGDEVPRAGRQVWHRRQPRRDHVAPAKIPKQRWDAPLRRSRPTACREGVRRASWAVHLALLMPYHQAAAHKGPVKGGMGWPLPTPHIWSRSAVHRMRHRQLQPGTGQHKVAA